jgi:hypothetical protein
MTITQMSFWSPKIPKIGILTTLEAHNYVCKPPIEVRFGKSCSPCQKLSDNMWHATCMQGNWKDSWLLMAKSQIGNLTPDLSFGHNLYFKYPNGSCKPILNIYVPRTFQWVLTPTIALWNFGSPSRFQLPKWEFTWECGSSFFHTFPHSQASLLARTFASPCLGCEPKAMFTTFRVLGYKDWGFWNPRISFLVFNDLRSNIPRFWV